MAGSVQDTYSSIRAKVAVVIERQNMLVAKMEAVKEENAQLRATIESLRQEISRLNVDNEYLTVASVLSPDRTQVEQPRSLLAGLVRDIDRCIAELSCC